VNWFLLIWICSLVGYSLYPLITNMTNIFERARRVQDPASGATTIKCSRRITKQVWDLAWQFKVKGSKHNGIVGTTKITENTKITKFSTSEIRKLQKRLKLILENIGLDFIVHTFSILIMLTYIIHFQTLLMHAELSQVGFSHFGT